MECFKYEDGRIYWKARPAHHFKSDSARKSHEAKFAGKEAGRKMHGQDYRQVLVCGKRLLVHRVIAAMHGLDTSLVIDHIDGQPSNNKIENLRACTQRNNTKNRVGWSKKRERVGVSQYRPGRWVAYIRENGKHMHLGTFARYEDAVAARALREAVVFGEFARKQQ